MFDGETFDEERDGERLNSQFERVRELMLDGEWRTLEAISTAVGYPTHSVSARLRDLRKPKFGGFAVHREYVSDGLWRYRVLAPPPPETSEQDTLFPSPARRTGMYDPD